MGFLKDPKPDNAGEPASHNFKTHPKVGDAFDNSTSVTDCV